MDDREQAIRAAADHVEQTRLRLEAGRSELVRLQESVNETWRHLDDMTRWIQATDEQLGRDPTPADE